MSDPAILDYQADWPTRFAAEAARIEEVARDLLDGPVQHIGSTSIPGMVGKDLIDMMAPVANLHVAAEAAERLAALGYHPRSHRVDAVLAVRGGHGLHLTQRGSDLWQERLLFRDTLRESEPLRRTYADLKRAMLAAPTPYDSRDKRDFVRQVLRDAGMALRDDRHADPGR